MITRIRRTMRNNDRGFTLIELLVVMIIIGILAAIAIPVFLNQRAKARDTSTKADVSTVGKEIATYFVDGTGTLLISQAVTPSGDISLTDAPGGAYTATLKVSSGTALASDSSKIVSGTNWCVGLTNADGKQKTYYYSATSGLQPGTCP